MGVNIQLEHDYTESQNAEGYVVICNAEDEELWRHDSWQLWSTQKTINPRYREMYKIEGLSALDIFKQEFTL